MKMIRRQYFHGIEIFAEGYPKSQQIACDASAPVDGVEETATSGASGLSYHAETDTYTYVWKTNKAWKNSCRQLIMKFDDNTVYRANFSFK